MDAALKQRLVGAAVLVALAVIFLPMLVDGPEPESGPAAVPLEMPPVPDRNFETRELPIAPAASTSPVPAPAVPATDSPVAEDPDRVVGIETDSMARVDALPEDASSAVAASSGADDAPPPIAAPAPAPRVVAPQTSATPVPASTPGGGYVVNLGSYGNVANARALVASLKTSGIAAYSDEIALDGKPALRVRIGPYAQRGEAEAARLAATRARSGLTATVVALDPADRGSATTPARAAIASGFAVQIGALKSEADASALRERARGAGFVTYVERVQTGSGPLWRVRVGPELQRSSADRLKAQVLQKMQIEGMVVSHP